MASTLRNKFNLLNVEWGAGEGGRKERKKKKKKTAELELRIQHL